MKNGKVGANARTKDAGGPTLAPPALRARLVLRVRPYMHGSPALPCSAASYFEAALCTVEGGDLAHALLLSHRRKASQTVLTSISAMQWLSVASHRPSQGIRNASGCTTVTRGPAGR